MCLWLLQASDITGVDSFREYALGQIEYMLGSSGRSFVCGFGNNPPQRPHHRSSSCPTSGNCDRNNFNNPGPNPQVLYGALGIDWNKLSIVTSHLWSQTF